MTDSIEIGTTVQHEFTAQGKRTGTVIDSDSEGVSVEWNTALSPDDKVWHMDPDSLTVQ